MNPQWITFISFYWFCLGFFIGFAIYAILKNHQAGEYGIMHKIYYRLRDWLKNKRKK